MRHESPPAKDARTTMQCPSSLPAMSIRTLTFAAVSLAVAVLSLSIPDPVHGQAAPTVTRDETSAPGATPFRTRYAYFVPSQFNELPGWRDDNLVEAWNAFRASCNVLASRSAWAGPCARSRSVGARDDAIRAFLEREFILYQIHDNNQSPAGVITGYYEPLLNGSRQYGGRYVYPVHGIPADLLYLDSRSLPRSAGGDPVYARVEGRAVIPCTGAQSDSTCRGPYRLDLGDARPDIRDKRVRVRIDGQRVVPYYTRAEIEQAAIPPSQAIVWVDDVAALYSMQVQGSGKVRLPDGQIVRLAYAEQNGHPFLPPVQSAAKRPRPRTTAVLTRGLEIPLEDDDDAVVSADFSRSNIPVLRGVGTPGAVERGIAAPANSAPAEPALSPEVARMVDLLLKGNEPAAAPPAPAATRPPLDRPASPVAVSAPPPAATVPPAPPRPAPPPPSPAVAVAPVAPPAAAAAPNPPRPVSPPQPAAVVAPAPPPVAVAPAAPATAARPSIFSNDPSYVFFRQIPDGEGGPVGALGVPLTAGRSVAVDPRTTPLGFPVFISTVGPSSTVNRLMLAQDTGGAIRGAVRADYFWGFGSGAGASASRMKEVGRMWLLLPRDLQLAAGAGVLTRGGIGGANEIECVVPDAELCVE